MSDYEPLSRWKDLRNHVVTQSAQAFVTSSFTRCLRANTEHTARSDLNCAYSRGQAFIETTLAVRL
jgi:hypothetical protein